MYFPYISIIDTIRIGIAINGIKYYDNTVYTANEGSVSVISVEDKRSPELVNTLHTGSSNHSIVAEGNFAYVSGSRLTVLDISDRLNPEIVSTLELPAVTRFSDVAPASPKNMVIKDGYLYYCSSENGVIKVVDVTDPYNPYVAGTGGRSEEAYCIMLAYDDVLAATHIGGFKTISISDPVKPTFMSKFPENFPEGILALYNDNKWGITSTEETRECLISYDISDPNNVRELTELSMCNAFGGAYGSGIPLDGVAENNYLFCVGSTGMIIIDLSEWKRISNNDGTGGRCCDLDDIYWYVGGIDNNVYIMDASKFLPPDTTVIDIEYNDKVGVGEVWEANVTIENRGYSGNIYLTKTVDGVSENIPVYVKGHMTNTAKVRHIFRKEGFHDVCID